MRERITLKEAIELAESLGYTRWENSDYSEHKPIVMEIQNPKSGLFHVVDFYNKDTNGSNDLEGPAEAVFHAANPFNSDSSEEDVLRILNFAKEF